MALARTNARSDHVVLDFSLLLSLHQGKESKKKLQHFSFFRLDVTMVPLLFQRLNFDEAGFAIKIEVEIFFTSHINSPLGDGGFTLYQ